MQKLWNGDDARKRAQALWLLTRLPENGKEYLAKALSDADPDIRITGIRIARSLKEDILPIAQHLIRDPSPQVRRELSLALRGNNSQEAAGLWTDLALQYDGKDRWYLEALGIGAAGNWDLYFDTWRKKVGKDWNSPANQDIVWRSRSKDAMPLMATLIKSSNERDMLRFYRAFDFQTDPSKQKVLAQLIQETEGDKVLYALKQMDPSQLKITPAIAAALNKVLEKEKDKIEFVELVTSFKLEDRTKDLLQMAIQYPDSLMGKEAAKTLLAWNKVALLESVLNKGGKEDALSLARALKPHMYDPKTIAMMEGVMMDSTKDMELRKFAVKSFGGPWEAEDRLLALAKENRIPADLQTAAGGVFQSAWRGALRNEAAQYLKLPGSKEGSPLPAISVLVEKQGDMTQGKAVFNSLCSTCHVVNGQGVNFGPELSEIGGKLSKEAMYSSILFPDQGISFGFEGFRFQLKDGSAAVGRIISETQDNVELQYMGNQQTVRKEDISARVKLESSLMPSNLQSSMSEQELVDLVAYLSSLKKDDRISENQ